MFSSSPYPWKLSQQLRFTVQWRRKDFRLQAIAQLRENAEAEVFWISTFVVADLNHRKQASQKYPELDCEYIHKLNLGVARTGLQNMPQI